MDKARSKATSLLGQLYFQVLIGFLLGIAVGYFHPGLGESLKPLGDGFIKLIKMLLAPIIFGTVVVGIAKMGNLKEVGRVGIKALRSEEHTSELQSLRHLVCRLLLEKKKKGHNHPPATPHDAHNFHTTISHTTH